MVFARGTVRQKSIRQGAVRPFFMPGDGGGGAEMGRRWTGGLAGLALALVGCHGLPAGPERTAAAGRLAEEGRLAPFEAAPAPLPLRGFARLGCPGQAIHVYIEGDGLAWISVSIPSSDPTPLNPVGLRLAVQDRACNVLYLGRPGQYGGAAVDARYWLGARFAPEVIDSYVAVLRAQPASLLRLTGYSGGGAVAALVAARLHTAGRPVELVTVAGNLDTATWTQRRKLSPMTASLNPADAAAALADVPQVHLAGRRDRQVPSWVLDAFLARLPGRDCVQVVMVDADHAGPWSEAVSRAPAPSCSPSRQSPR